MLDSVVHGWVYRAVYTRVGVQGGVYTGGYRDVSSAQSGRDVSSAQSGRDVSTFLTGFHFSDGFPLF